jgi:hypothetical protein
MRAYPIWVTTTNCNYKNGGHRYGFRETGETEYRIGSGPANSHEFLDTTITKRVIVYKNIPFHVFRFKIRFPEEDNWKDMVIKYSVFSDNKGRPGKLLYNRHWGGGWMPTTEDEIDKMIKQIVDCNIIDEKLIKVK